MRSNGSPDPARIPVVAAALRTPIGRIGGSLAAIEPAGLAAPLIRRILAETGLAPEAVDDVILGNAANSAGNLARLAALEAGLPVCVPGIRNGIASNCMARLTCTAKCRCGAVL